MVRLWKLAVCLLVFLAACSTPPVTHSPLTTPIAPGESPPATPTRPTELPALVVESGMGGVRGRLTGMPSSWEGRDVYVYACPFTPSEGGDGFFFLEPSVHPSTLIDSQGRFQMGNVPPGQHVLVAGPGPEEAIPFQEAGRTAVYDVTAAEILDLGNVRLQ